MATPIFGLADCNNFYVSCEWVLRSDYGARTVRVGKVRGTRPPWAMGQAFRRPRYTMRWWELPVVC
jgi:hypothetical protein